MKPLSAESLSARLLGKLAWAVIHRPRWFFWPQIILFGLSILYTVKFLEFRTNRNDLVGSGKKYHQNFLAFKKEFPTQDDLVVVVESENALRTSIPRRWTPRHACRAGCSSLEPTTAVACSTSSASSRARPSVRV